MQFLLLLQRYSRHSVDDSVMFDRMIIIASVQIKIIWHTIELPIISMKT